MKSTKLVFGVGINDSDYVTNTNKGGVRCCCPFYRRWKDMMRRAYCKKWSTRYPSYRDVSVATEWHSFMTFKSWMEKQEWEGKHLDKDLLINGNKIYGPYQCVFINQEVNKFTSDRLADRGEFKLGVTACGSKYRSSIGFSGKKTHLGVFDTEEEARKSWLSAKLEIATSIALLQEDPRVVAALMDRYTVE